MEDFRKYAEQIVATHTADQRDATALKQALRASRQELKAIINSESRERDERNRMIMAVHMAIADAEYRLLQRN
jgi:phosphoenolpyruvate-protein kinase (PTS system EI component)